jgi:hypothetical protein
MPVSKKYYKYIIVYAYKNGIGQTQYLESHCCALVNKADISLAKKFSTKSEAKKVIDKYKLNAKVEKLIL